MLYSAVLYSTVQYSTVQYSTVQYSTVQYSTVQYSTVQYSTVTDSSAVVHSSAGSKEVTRLLRSGDYNSRFKEIFKTKKIWFNKTFNFFTILKTD